MCHTFMVVLKVMPRLAIMLPAARQQALTKVHHRMLLATLANHSGVMCLKRAHVVQHQRTGPRSTTSAPTARPRQGLSTVNCGTGKHSCLLRAFKRGRCAMRSPWPITSCIGTSARSLKQ